MDNSLNVKTIQVEVKEEDKVFSLEITVNGFNKEVFHGDLNVVRLEIQKENKTGIETVIEIAESVNDNVVDRLYSLLLKNIKIAENVEEDKKIIKVF